jgi:perosamine synthetase
VYVSAWPALAPSLLARPRRNGAVPAPFPFGAPRTQAYHVARYGIYQLFRALQFGSRDRVLVPAYHHGNEVRAIRAAGAQPFFYSIGTDLQPDMSELDRLLRSRPRALYLIHYLGLPQPVFELARRCRELGILLIEDCALALLSGAGDRPLGSFGDHSIFCLYKTLPVPNGGLLVQNREDFLGLERVELRTGGALSLAARSAELVGDWLRGRSDRLGRALGRLKSLTGQGLTALGLQRAPVGDSGFDVANADLGAWRLSLRLLERFDYAEIRARRRRNYAALRERLAGRTPLLVERELAAGVCPLFFPLLVADKSRAAVRLRENGIDSVTFWNSGDPEAERGRFEPVQFLRRHVLELPIHQDLDLDHVHQIADRVLELLRVDPAPRIPCFTSSASVARIA